MSTKDRRAERKAKKRQERLRQQKHERKFGWGVASSGPDPDYPTQLPQTAINVHHVTGGDMVLTEQTNRAMDFMLKQDPPKDHESLQEKLNLFLGNAWEDHYNRMLLVDETERAQDFAFQALEADTPRTSSELARKALAIDPACCDAHFVRATREIADAEKRLAILEGAVTSEHERLGGAAYFKENKGHFWSINRTRPYMRALYACAITLKALGRYAEAAKHCSALLELCTDDRQAVRYQYLACLMAGDRIDELGPAIEEHRDDADAAWLWARVLERLLADDDTGAQSAITTARSANFMVPAILLMPALERHACPSHYTPGEATEAVYIADVYGCAWDQHAGALSWLREHG